MKNNVKIILKGVMASKETCHTQKNTLLSTIIKMCLENYKSSEIVLITQDNSTETGMLENFQNRGFF